MATKTIQTRIGLKYDFYASWVQKGNWSNGTFTADPNGNSSFDAGFYPLKGEIVFYYVPGSTGAVVQEPAVLFKVGDGIHSLKDLPWGSAIAADVYSWAKQQSILGGVNTGGTWVFDGENVTPVQEATQAEVAAFIRQETSDIQMKVEQVSPSNYQTIYGETYDPNDPTMAARIGKYQISVSTDGGASWTASGQPFSIQIEQYSAGSGLNLSNNEFSVKTKTGGYIQNTSTTDGQTTTDTGIDVIQSSVTYTPAGQDSPANLTATSGLLTEASVPTIKSYIDAKSGENEVTLTTAQQADTGFLTTYILSQGGSEVGRINIPKDFLVKSASLETVATANHPYTGAIVGEKYIDFVINSMDSDAEEERTDSHIYLPVKDLVDVYTGDWLSTDGQGHAGGFVKIEVDSNNEISAHYYTQSLFNITSGDQNYTFTYYPSGSESGISGGKLHIAGHNPDGGVIVEWVEYPTGSQEFFDGLNDAAGNTSSVFSYTENINVGDILKIYSEDSQYIEITGVEPRQTGDGLATAVDVKAYVDSVVASATPNIQAGNGIDIATSGSTKTVSIELDETNDSPFSNNTGSGLALSEDGLKIDDALTFVLFSGGATENIENITVAYAQS
jgi:hypothetical protein